jgi:cytochrome c peroxidase
LFAGKAFCSTCHNGENLSDSQFYNIGIHTEDVGRFAITGDERDMGRIRTPGLYGVVHTAPYMRDGSLANLEEVIDYYNRGGDGHPNTSFFIIKWIITYLEKRAEDETARFSIYSINTLESCQNLITLIFL